MDQEMLDMFHLVIDKIDQMDKRIDNMDKRIDNMDKRIDSMDKRIDSMDKRIEMLDKKVDEMNQRQAVFEHETSYKLGALFDGYQMNLEYNEELKQRLDKMQRIK